MSEKIKKVCDVTFIIMTFILALAFVFSAVAIYSTGLTERDNAARGARIRAEELGLSEEETALAVAKAVSEVKIYSRNIVSAKFKRILPLIVLWVLNALIAAFVSLSVIKKQTTKRRVPAYMSAEALAVKRVCEAKAGHEEELADAEHRLDILHTRVKKLRIFTYIPCALLAVFPVVFFLLPSSLPKDEVNAQVLASVLLSLPFILAIFAVIVVSGVLREKADVALCGVYKEERLHAAKTEKVERKRTDRAVTVSRILLLAIGVVLVVVGIFNGSAREVLAKATKICTECIGLG